MDDASGFSVIEESSPSRPRLYNPVGFDPRTVLPERFWRHADSVRYFLHLIHHHRFMYRRRSSDFIELKATYVGRFFADKNVFGEVKKVLIDRGVIECDGHYIEGRKSLGYRLGQAWRNTEFTSVRVHDPVLVRKLTEKRSGRLPVEHEVHRYLRDWVQRLTFDHDAARRFVAERRLKDQDIALDAFQNKDWFFQPCRYGRVHHNVSSLKSELRRFLSFEGQPLVNLDVRNSQPLLFCIVLLNHLLNGGALESLYSWKMDSSHLYYELPSYLFSSFEAPIPNPPTELPLRFHSLITTKEDMANWKDTTRRLLGQNIPEDALLYIEFCQKGMLYDHLMLMGGIPAERRQSFKRQFFNSVFFCKNTPVRHHARLFAKVFPSVYRVVTDIKENDHRTLAHVLQRTESSLLINRIARRCMEELPETCIVTIHDSVMTTPDAAAHVMEIMRQEFLNVGLDPAIRAEAHAECTV